MRLYEHDERGESRPLPHQAQAAEAFLASYDIINKNFFDGRGSGRSWFWLRVIKFLISHDYGVFLQAKDMPWWRHVIARASSRYGNGGLRT